ncbi:MAG: hypothetical protein LBG58_10105 [Planctomycetaceae bacterium]|jgi:hypothetical protein|nr:hypothetical protein [Planctomycetaceae bacterium]
MTKRPTPPSGNPFYPPPIMDNPVTPPQPSPVIPPLPSINHAVQPKPSPVIPPPLPIRNKIYSAIAFAHNFFIGIGNIVWFIGKIIRVYWQDYLFNGEFWKRVLLLQGILFSLAVIAKISFLESQYDVWLFWLWIPLSIMSVVICEINEKYNYGRGIVSTFIEKSGWAILFIFIGLCGCFQTIRVFITIQQIVKQLDIFN